METLYNLNLNRFKYLFQFIAYFVILPLILLTPLKEFFLGIDDTRNLDGIIGLNLTYFFQVGILASLFHFIAYKIIFNKTINSFDIQILNGLVFVSSAFYCYLVYDLLISNEEILAKGLLAVVMLSIPLTFVALRNLVVKRKNNIPLSKE